MKMGNLELEKQAEYLGVNGPFGQICDGNMDVVASTVFNPC